MNFVKLSIFAAAMVLMPTALIAESFTSCVVPSSKSMYLIESVPPEPSPRATELPGMSDATEAAGIGNAVSTSVSLVASGVSQVAQGVRANSILEITSCDDNSNTQGSLSWMDSPTQLSLGNSSLQYDLGAVVGNWALLGGTAAVWSLAAYRYGTALLRFPGGLTMPVLFLLSPTITSSVSLLRDGTVTQQLLGGCSLTAQVLGTGLIAVFLHPSHFSARWGLEEEEPKWLDGREKNYIKHYGMLFKDYRAGRHGFITAELLTSFAIGTIKSYLGTEGNCKPVLTASAAVSLVYALSLIGLRPNIERREQIFYGAMSGAMAAALTLQAVSLWTGSKDTQEKTRTIAESVIQAVEWALFAKSLYDIAKGIGSVYRYFRSKSDRHNLLDAPLVPIKGEQEASAGISCQLLFPPVEEAHILDVPMPEMEPAAEESDPLSDPVDVSASASPLPPEDLSSSGAQRGSCWFDPDNPNPLDEISSVKNEISSAQEELL